MLTRRDKMGPYLLPKALVYEDKISSLEQPFIKKERLRFIDTYLFWTGVLRRDDICKAFELHETNASRDIAIYRQLNPNSVIYDTSEKCYKTTPMFRPIGPHQSLQSLFSYNTLNMAWSGYAPQYIHTTPLPNRQPDISTVRNFIMCAEYGYGIEIVYYSLNNPSGLKRTIFPKHIIFDGLRWHTRAFDDRTQTYRDFVLSRVETINNLTGSLSMPKDEEWAEIVDIIIKPHEELSKEQAKLIEKDFNMEGGQLSIKSRRPLAYYLIRNLYLDVALLPPRQLIQCVNLHELGIA